MWCSYRSFEGIMNKSDFVKRVFSSKQDSMLCVVLIGSGGRKTL